MGRYKGAGLFIIGLIALLGCSSYWLRTSFAEGNSVWSAQSAPKLNKVVELPLNRQPDGNNVDCDRSLYLPSELQTSENICTFASPLGTLATDGRMVISSDKLANLYGQTRHSAFLPTVNSSLAVVSETSLGIGNYLGFYRHLNKADLKQTTDEPGSYYVSAVPDQQLADPQTGSLLQVDTTSMAYSANGEWMVVNLPHRGLLRVHMSDLSVKLLTGSFEPSWYLSLADRPLAISNDGRYVAANTDIFGQGNMMVYDTSTCDNQLDVPVNEQKFCVGEDIWHGKSAEQGLLAVQPGMEYPTHIRFVNDSTISFSAQHDVTSGVTFKAAEYVVAAVGASQHNIGLLGLGDSYISGQGAFSYREGTDTANDTCHTSELSYPYILGAQNFDSYSSVACSGARTFDVIGRNEKYEGQTADKIQEQNRNNKQTILSKFLPGYIYQEEFANTYLPEAMLLSVGGDDIDFADIVKSCVANAGGGTCYSTYEDRAELVKEINAIYPKLVNTYQTLREQSGYGQLYVVGYPQIAQPGGNCGANVHLNSAEVSFSSQLIAYLDSVIQRAADSAGVFYVDAQDAFDGHKLCEPGSKAMNGLTAGTDAGIKLFGQTINFIGAESYHPSVLGYQLLAEKITEQTDNLRAPMPAAIERGAPVFDSSMDILQNVPKTGRPLNDSINDQSLTPDEVVAQGESQTIALAGDDSEFAPNSRYQVVLHSQPTLLKTGTVASDGALNATFTVPADAEPGYHLLHVYGNNMAGEPLDIQKIIYVASSLNDLSGNSMTNPCGVIAASGQDIDHDGTDDACDPDITDNMAQGPMLKATASVSATVTYSTDWPTSGANDAADVKSASSSVMAGNNTNILLSADAMPNQQNPKEQNMRDRYTSPTRSTKPMIVVTAIILLTSFGFTLKTKW